MLRDHGQAQKYYHEMEGYNGRLDAIQAGMLRVKLRHLPRWNEGRRAAAARYRELLSPIGGIVIPYEPDWSRAVYHLYVIRSSDREALQKHLNGQGIGTGLHYPVPLHVQKAYAGTAHKDGSFPITDRASREILSLPMFPQLTPEQQNAVTRAITTPHPPKLAS